MDKNLHDDNLERFFKKQFDEQSSQSAEDWDTPSSDVWVGIKESLPPPKLPFYRSPWVILATGIVIGALTIFLYQSLTTPEKIDINPAKKELKQPQANSESLLKTDLNSNNEIETKEPSNSISNNELGALKERIAALENNLNLNHINSISEKREKEISQALSDKAIANDANPSVNKDIPNAPNSAIGNGSLLNDEVPLIAKDQTKSNTPSSEVLKQAGQNSLEHKQLNASLERLPQQWSYLNVENRLPFIGNLPIFKLLERSAIKPKKWNVALNASPSYNFRQLRKAPPNLPQPPPMFLEEEKPNIGITASLNVGYQIDQNWSLISGLNYLQHRQKSEKRGFLRYSDQGGELNGSEYTRNYNVNVNTSFGDGELEIRVSDERTGDQMDLKNGDKIHYRIDHNISVHQLGVPLLGQYARKFGNFSIGLQAGLLGSKIVDRQVDAQLAIAGPHPRLRQTRVKVKKSFDALKDYHLDWQAGVALTYDFNDNFGVQIKPNYRQSFTNVFDENGIKTYPYSFAFDTGIVYRL